MCYSIYILCLCLSDLCITVVPVIPSCCGTYAVNRCRLFAASPRDIDAGDKFGRTPLMYCVLGDRMECAEMLIKAGADVNKQDIGGRTSLHWAAHKVSFLSRWAGILCFS